MRKRRLGKDVKRGITPEFVNMSKEILYPQIQGVTQASFAEARDEVAQSRKASHDPLYSFQVLDGPHVGDGRDFLRVGLDAPLVDDEP